MMFTLQDNRPIVRLTKTTRWFSYVVLPQLHWGKPMFMPKTRLAVGGTRWSFNDMVREVEEQVMSVHDAEPGDVYVDAIGKLWRCVSICHEPTVVMEEVEGHTSAPPDPMIIGMAAQQYHPPGAPPIMRNRRFGGVQGLMWDGWKRIWRKEQA